MITVAECLSIVIADLSLVASGWSLHHRIAKEGLAAFGMAGIDHYQELTSTQRNAIPEAFCFISCGTASGLHNEQSC
jgi:hypothetical protein